MRLWVFAPLRYYVFGLSAFSRRCFSFISSRYFFLTQRRKDAKTQREKSLSTFQKLDAFALRWRVVDKKPSSDHFIDMASAPANDRNQFSSRKRRKTSDFLTPPPLTPAQVENIYGRNGEEDARERKFGRAVFEAVRRTARKGARP